MLSGDRAGILFRDRSDAGRRLAEALMCLRAFAIGQFHPDFSQTSDADFLDRLAQAGDTARPPTGPPARIAEDDPPGRDDEVQLRAGGVWLSGHLNVPPGAPRIVVFAHGSGSSRQSPRNRYVASVLAAAGLGTLLFDLLTPEEELRRGNVFDVELLAERLADATGWLRGEPESAGTRIGYFGASTGAAAALWAATDPAADIGAVVSRGGRPDLVASRLSAVRAPTLLIVGGEDHHVLELNRWAHERLRCEKRLAVVPGATHLFEEPGTLTTVADLAREWFVSHLGGVEAPAG